MHIDTTVDAAIQTADLVVEAVVENMELKQKLFAEYDDKVMIITMKPSSTKPESLKNLCCAGPSKDHPCLKHFFSPNFGNRLLHPSLGQVIIFLLVLTISS